MRSLIAAPMRGVPAVLALLALGACAGSAPVRPKRVEEGGPGQRVCGGAVAVERADVARAEYAITLLNVTPRTVAFRHTLVFLTEEGLVLAGEERWEEASIGGGESITLKGKPPFATARGLRVRAEER